MIPSRQFGPRRKIRRQIFISALVLLLACAAELLPFLRHVDNLVRDSFYHFTPASSSPSNVALVLIDDASLHQIGRWPWPRARIADLVSRLHDSGTKVIGLDILFAEPQSAAEDGALASALRSAGNVVLVSKLGDAGDGSHWVEPLPLFRQTATAIGHAQAALDTDGVCRRFPPREPTLDGPAWAFSIEVGRRADPAITRQFLHAYHLSFLEPATDIDVVQPLLVPIRYRGGGPNAFTVHSAVDVLAGRNNDELKDKVVLVGFGASELSDRLVTPVSSELPTPGVEVHAHIVDSILEYRLTYPVPSPYWFGMLFLISLATVEIAQRCRAWIGIAAVAIGLVTAYVIAAMAFVGIGMSCPVFPILAAFVLGPSLVHASEFVDIERKLNARLLEVREDLRTRTGYAAAAGAWSGSTEGPLPWKLQLLAELQATLGSLYQFEHTLLEATHDLIAVFDSNGTMVFANSAFCRFSTALAIGERPCWPRLEELIRTGIQDGGMEGDLLQNFSCEALLKNELWSVRGIQLPATKFFGLGTLLVAMTNLQLRLERDRARSESLAFITHELRTPMTAIQGYAELLMHCPGTSSTAKAPEVIFRESRRMLVLINTYLDVLRIDAGAHSLRLEKIDIGPMLSYICEILQPMAEAQGIRLVYLGTADVTVQADRTLLTGALLNLVSNAIKYGRENSVIRMASEISQDGVHFSVWNDGEAITEADQRRVFDPYFRSPKVEGRKPGWGLGLAFVKRIAEKHGGKVVVRSKTGEGTTFVLSLPRRAAIVAHGAYA